MGQRALGQEYFDNSPFCVGYREGSIKTIIPAPECWGEASPPGAFVGPLLPDTVYDVGARFEAEGVAPAPSGYLSLLLIALGAIVIAQSQKK